LSPRIDHRPPIIAFLLLVMVAVAVIGTSARAVDGWVFSTGPLATRAEASGSATIQRAIVEPQVQRTSVVLSQRRAQAPSRDAGRADPGERWRDRGPAREHHAWHKRSSDADRHRGHGRRHHFDDEDGRGAWNR
jgi:hypothetical protein